MNRQWPLWKIIWQKEEIIKNKLKIFIWISYNALNSLKISKPSALCNCLPKSIKRLRANEGCRSEKTTYFLEPCGMAQRILSNNGNHISWRLSKTHVTQKGNNDIIKFLTSYSTSNETLQRQVTSILEWVIAVIGYEKTILMKSFLNKFYSSIIGSINEYRTFSYKESFIIRY